MTPETATIIREGLALDLDERALVANTLLASLHGGDPDGAQEAWRTEVTRRLDDVRSGEVELVDADEHYARLRAEFTKPSA